MLLPVMLNYRIHRIERKVCHAEIALAAFARRVQEVHYVVDSIPEHRLLLVKEAVQFEQKWQLHVREAERRRSRSESGYKNEGGKLPEFEFSYDAEWTPAPRSTIRPGRWGSGSSNTTQEQRRESRFLLREDEERNNARTSTAHEDVSHRGTEIRHCSVASCSQEPPAEVLEDPRERSASCTSSTGAAGAPSSSTFGPPSQRSSSTPTTPLLEKFVSKLEEKKDARDKVEAALAKEKEINQVRKEQEDGRAKTNYPRKTTTTTVEHHDKDENSATNIPSAQEMWYQALHRRPEKEQEKPLHLRSLLDINFPLTANEFHSMVRRAVHIQNPDTDNFPLNFTNYTTYELQKHRTRINCNTN